MSGLKKKCKHSIEFIYFFFIILTIWMYKYDDNIYFLKVNVNFKRNFEFNIHLKNKCYLLIFNIFFIFM